jgi:hypothetical protein
MPSARYNLRKNPKPSANLVTVDMLDFSESDDDASYEARPSKKRRIGAHEDAKRAATPDDGDSDAEGEGEEDNDNDDDEDEEEDELGGETDSEEGDDDGDGPSV